MGSAQSIVSPEGAATVLAVAGAIGLGYTQLARSSQPTPESASGEKQQEGAGASKNAKKKKGKKTANAVPGDFSEAAHVPAARGANATTQPVSRSASIPGGFGGPEDLSPAPSPSPDASAVSAGVKANSKKNKKKSAARGTTSGTPTPAGSQMLSTAENGLSASTPTSVAASASLPLASSTPSKKAGSKKASTVTPASASVPVPTSGTGTATPTPKRPLVTTLAPPPRSRTPPPPSASSSSVASRNNYGLESSAISTKSTRSIDTDGSWTRVGTGGKTPAVAGAGPSGSSGGHTKSKSAAKREKKKAVRDALAKEAAAGAVRVETSPEAGSDTGKRDETEDEDDDAQQSFLLSESANSAPADNRRTLAEKLLPKPRKTGVDDMLETPQYPTVARVMRVQPQPHEKPAEGFTWADYEDVDAPQGADEAWPENLDEILDSGSRGADTSRQRKDPDADTGDDEDDVEGWGVVKSRKPKRTTSSTPGGTPSSSQTLSVSRTTGTEPLTKKQRQNQHRKEVEKTAKAEAEQARLEALARHKRELERTKIAEQYKTQGKGAGKGGVSGGMKASVEGGRLVWE